jgi:D-amino-acid oxidase
MCKRANILLIVKREIRDPLEVFEMRDIAPFDVLINASGIGFGDHNVFITTGKLHYIR